MEGGELIPNGIVVAVADECDVIDVGAIGMRVGVGALLKRETPLTVVDGRCTRMLRRVGRARSRRVVVVAVTLLIPRAQRIRAGVSILLAVVGIHHASVIRHPHTVPCQRDEAVAVLLTHDVATVETQPAVHSTLQQHHQHNRYKATNSHIRILSNMHAGYVNEFTSIQ